MGPPVDYLPNKVKNKDKDSTYCLSNRSFVLAKFHMLFWSALGKCDRPGFSLGASYAIADHYIFATFIAVALHERLGNLRNL